MFKKILLLIFTFSPPAKAGKNIRPITILTHKVKIYSAKTKEEKRLSKKANQYFSQPKKYLVDQPLNKTTSDIFFMTTRLVPNMKKIKRTQHTCTALHAAVICNQFTNIVKLLENGADPNILDSDNLPPIAYATNAQTKNLLLFNGAKIWRMERPVANQ